MATTVTYKNNTLVTVNNQTKTLKTAGKFLEDDITLVDVSGGTAAISVVDTADAAGGNVRTITALDISDTTAVAGDVASGKYFYTANGTKTLGTASSGGDKAVEKDVNFIDYDGTLLYSYTAAEAQALSALPANPSHTGLTAQGWNWTLAEIKAQLTAVPGGPIWVGQQYVTTSGATEIDIRLKGDALSPYLILGVNGTTTINWGDSSSDTLTGTNYATTQFTQHIYANPGDYTITLSGGQYRFNGSSSKCGVLSNQAGHTSSSMYSNCVLAIRSGATSELRGFANYPLRFCTHMRYITIPSTCAEIGQDFVSECLALRAVVLPSAYTGGSYAKFNRGLQRISLSASWTTFGAQVIQQCDSLQSVTIPTGTTAIGNSAFSNSRSLTKIYIPGTVTSIGTSAFNNCYSMTEYHLLSTSPPTLGGTNAFTGIQQGCKIYVPYSEDHSVLLAYQSESIWSDFASYMQEEPQ